jgi:hypothetical protein
MAAIAGIIMFFTASIIFIFGLLYLTDRAVGWEETWDEFGWREERVIQWQWMMAGILFMASFAAGIVGGIAAIRGTRFPLAISGAMLLLTSSIILQWDYMNWVDSIWGEIAYMLVFSILVVALLVMARPVFTAPLPSPGVGPPSYATDNYGWSAMPGQTGPQSEREPDGVGP